MEALVAKIESMGDDVHSAIEKLIHESGVPCSCNNKYTFVDMSTIPPETLHDILNIVNVHCNNECDEDQNDDAILVRSTDAIAHEDECGEAPKASHVFEVKTKKKTQPKKSFIVTGKRQEQYDAQQNELDIQHEFT